MSIIPLKKLIEYKGNRYELSRAMIELAKSGGNLLRNETKYRKGKYIPTVTTKFMKLMREHGKMAYNGLKMLLYQGVAAFEIWNRCEVSKDIADRVYISMKEALGINE